MLTQSQVQDSRRVGRQVPDPDKDPDLTHKTHHQKERRVSHQKKKDRQNQSTTTSTQTQTTCMREESHTKGKRKKKNHTTHSRAHPPPGTQTHNPIPSATHSTFLLLLPTLPVYILAITHSYTLPAYCPHVYQHFPTHLRPPCYHSLTHTACCHCTTTRVYILARNCTYACLGLATARPQPVFRSLTVATSPLAWLPLFTCTTTIRLLSAYCSHVCLHYCARLLQYHAYRLGFSHCAHHSPSSSPSTCHPGCLRYHQSLTRVHSHSLPVPPPLPLADARSQGGSTVGRSRSLAPVPGVRLFFMVPLAGESPLADARLPPHPNGHLLFATARPYTPIHAYTVFASTPLVRIHAHILSSTPADILAVSSVHTMLTVLHPVLPA